MSQENQDRSPTNDSITHNDQAELGLRDFINKNPALTNVIGAGIIIIATLLAYVPAMKAGFIWDDDYYVTNNHLLRSWEGLQRIWFDVLPHPSEYSLPQYYPMTSTSFWLEYRLWGLNPAGFHIVNIVLHIANALLVWLILRKLSVPGAWLAAAIFALHPINVESVAWIAERKNVLSLLFFLCSLYVYLRYAGIIKGSDRKAPISRPQGEDAAGQIEWFTLPDDPARLYALAAVLFACALLSKTVSSSMPAVVLLLILWKRGKITLKDIYPLLPLLAAGIGMGLLTAFIEKWRVGVAAMPEIWTYAPTAMGNLGARCIIAGRALWFYAGKLLLPYPLIFNYPRWSIDPYNAVQYVYPACAVLVLVLLLVLRKRWGGGLAVAWLFYAGTLFPAMGFINVWPMQYSFVADHFAYLSSIGLIALAAAVAVRYLSIDVIAGVAGVVLLLFLGMTFAQARIYRDSNTLWQATWLASGKRSWLAANNYGVILERQGNLDAAEKWFQTVLQLKPNHAQAHLNLAQIALDRADDARQLRSIAATRPAGSFSTALPTTREIDQYIQQAIDYYNQAIADQPNYVDAHYYLGMLLRSLGRSDEAIEHFNKVIQIYPRHAPAHLMLGELAQQRGDIQQATEQLIRAVEIDPDYVQAHVNLGTVLLQGGHVVEGLQEWDLAMQLDPENAQWPNLFGAKMFASGEDAKAIDYFRQALRIDPRNVEAMTNLGVVAARRGFPDQAKALFEEALKIKPGFAKAKQDLEELKSGRLGSATTQAATRPAGRTAP